MHELDEVLPDFGDLSVSILRLAVKKSLSEEMEHALRDPKIRELMVEGVDIYLVSQYPGYASNTDPEKRRKALRALLDVIFGTILLEDM